MAKKKNGGPVHPGTYIQSLPGGPGAMTTMFTTSGMTMRQYYKAAALQGLIGEESMSIEDAAKYAAQAADAMLAEDAEFEGQDDA